MPNKNNDQSSPIVARVSRKVKTCDECRRHKIRCSLGPNQSTPCSRCDRMSLECRLTKNLQSILEEHNSDAKWKESVEERLDMLFALVSSKDDVEINPQSTKKRRISNHDVGEDVNTDYNPTASDPLNMLADAAGHAPTSSSPSGITTKRNRPDIIDRGLITFKQSCVFVDIYLTYLDPQVYSIVGLVHVATDERNRLHTTVQSIRRSPLLLLAICTVASLHCSTNIRKDGTFASENDNNQSASQTYSTLHDEFVRLSAQQSFVRHQSLDDIRALLIGSWWLRDLSWILTGSAVRLATERGMQEAYKKCSNMEAGKKACQSGTLSGCVPGEAVSSFPSAIDDETIEQEAYKAARLYYLVYVADHQAAMPFSRPPMTRQHAAVRNVRAWLAGCRLANDEDARLTSQVELWVIAHDVLDDFGVDVQEALTRKQVLEEAPRYFALVDRWQKRWKKRNELNKINEEEIKLQAEMMRLFIGAHVFRSPPNTDPLSIEGRQEDEQGIYDEMEQRQSFATKSMPAIPDSDSILNGKDEKSQRYTIGQIAIHTASRLIDLMTNTNFAQSKSMQEWKRSGMYGQPIYPFAMLIFACLFLHKSSKQNQQSFSINLEEIMNMIDKVCQSLQAHLMPFCVDAHICGTVLPGLLSLLTSERAKLSKANKVQLSDGSEGIFQQFPEVTHHSANDNILQQSVDSLIDIPQPFQDTFTSPMQSGTPAFSFDLQSLDLLSDLRYLSGVGSDALLWDLAAFEDSFPQS
jgi:Fungal Zn(2)-Cys(6) binuclear cluster domain/Fungal specific transcription factor domain